MNCPELGQAGEEVRTDNGGKRSVEVEVVPLENSTERRRHDDLALLRGGNFAGWAE